MLLEETADDAALVLTDRHYRQLRLGVETYRQELVLRLGAEVGLRPAEMTRIRPTDVTTHERGGRLHHFVAVPDEDGGVDRQAYLPDDVENDLRKYVRAEDVAEDDRVLPVTPRRVQMLVSEIVQRTADRTGNDRFETVSSRSLRRYFARQLLDEEGVHPKVVQAVGGWERLASLEAYLSEPDRSDVVAAFERTTLSARGGHGLDAATLAEAIEGCGHAVYVTDEDGVIEYVNRTFEEMTGYVASDAIGRTPQTLVGDDADGAAEPCWETLEDGEVYEQDVTAQRDGGEEYRVHQTITPITASDGTRRFVAVAEERSEGDGGATVSDRFDAVLDRIRAVGEELVASSMREEIEQRTCQRLAEGDAYEFAWAGKRSGQELLSCASYGIDSATVDRLATASGATQTALSTDSVVATADVTEDPEFETWATHADEAGFEAAAVVPVTDGDTTYGVLNLGTNDPDAFDERERMLLADLGNRIGQALTAAERRKLLLADTVVELEFKTTDESSFFVAAATEFGCTFTLEGVVPGEEGSLLYFVVLEEGDADAVLQWAKDRDCIADVRLVRDYGDEALLEFVVTDSEASKLLTEQGGTVREMTVEDGVQTFVGAMPSDADVRETVYTLTDAFPKTELLTKHEREKSIETAAAFRSSLQNALTEKQAAVIQAAHHAGYFEWPRGSTAEELADSMGITSPTLHNHLRRGLQKLLVTFFEEQDQQLLGDETPWASD
jgi:PAS domain S-box-containing protein